MTLAPAASVAPLHVTVLVPLHEKAGLPLVWVADWNVALRGVTSVTTTLAASSGPEFDTDTMKLKFAPESTLLEARPLLIARSTEAVAPFTSKGVATIVEPLLEMMLTFQAPRLSTVVVPITDV